MTTSRSTQFTCSLCGEPAALEACKTDDHGHIVHEFCYGLRLRLVAAPDAVLEFRRRELSQACRRPWKEIAMDVLRETDRRRFDELVAELDAALTARELAAKNPSPPPRVSQSVAYEKIVDVAVSVMRSDYASLQMLFPERGVNGELRLLAFRGFNPRAAKFWEWVRADSQSTCGIALRDTQRVVAPDIAACDFMEGSEDQQVYLHTGIHACQTTPLVTRAGNVVGMISTHWRTPHQPSKSDFRDFDLLARQAADLIQSSVRQGEL